MASDLLQARAQHYGETMALRDEAEYVERRRTQNRIAQRNFRKNEKERQARQAMENNSAKASITSAPRSHPQNFVPPTSWDQPAQSSGQSWPPPDDSAMDYSYSMPTSPLQINTFQDQPYPNQFDYSSLDSVLDSMCGQDMYAMSASSTPTYSMTPQSTTPTYSMTPNSTTPPYSMTPAGSRTPAMSLQSTNSIPTLTLNNDINNQDNVMMEGHSRARSKTMPDELNVQNLDFFDHSFQPLQDPHNMAGAFPHPLVLPSGGTALHKATHRGHKEVAKLLLDRGADPNAMNENGSTPLHVAAEMGALEIAEMLVKRGSNVDAKDNMGRTVMHCAAEGECEQLLRLLIDKGAHIDSLDFAGRTALHQAAEGGRDKVVRLLLSMGADINLVHA